MDDLKIFFCGRMTGWDKISGKSIVLEKNKLHYLGEIKDNLRDGKGTYYSENQKLISAVWLCLMSMNHFKSNKINTGGATSEL